MNERIRELADEAGIYKLNLSDETEYWIMEKFAELIVQECIEQVITGPNGPAHYAVEAALRLKKHFGVEE
jgi:hypothetical protein